MTKRYTIQNRHQDESWEWSGCDTDSLSEAIGRAREMKRHPMIYGMVRIIDRVEQCEVDDEQTASFTDRVRRGLDFDN